MLNRPRGRSCSRARRTSRATRPASRLALALAFAVVAGAPTALPAALPAARASASAPASERAAPALSGPALAGPALARRALSGPAILVPPLPNPLGAGATMTLGVTGVGGVPADGVAAVVLTVTATGATADTFVTVWPAGEARPQASSLNPAAGRTVANTVLVPVGAGGAVAIYNNAGTVDVVVDLDGWLAPGAGAHVVAPRRVFDSRLPGAGGSAPRPLGQDEVREVPVAGVVVDGSAVVPPEAVAAIVNITTTGSSAASSFVTAWPAGAPRPWVSNLNPASGRTEANLAVVRLGTGGAIDLYNRWGRTDAIVDVLGWLGASAGFVGDSAARVFDTRDGSGRLGPGATVSVDVGPGSVGAEVALVNLTATGASADTHLVVWPAGAPRPATSSLNPAPGATVANTLLVGLGPPSSTTGGTGGAGATGAIEIANHAGSVDVIVDRLGAFTAASGITAVTPVRIVDTRGPDVRHAFPVDLAASPAPAYSRAHHDYPATDIFAACGTTVVSPVDGVVVHVRRIDRYDPAVANPATLGGRSIAVVGDDGVRYYGSHLDTFVDGIAVGVRVAAGQPLATVGRTGDAGACHLHFGIGPPCPGVEWAVRRGVVWPWPYLDSWRAGGDASPAREVARWAAAHPGACADAEALATAPDSEDPPR